MTMSSSHRPQVIAHRGYSAALPENTMPAFAAAIAAGAGSIELDVVLSGDGQAMVIHDDTLDRTTSGTGLVSSATAARIARLDAGSWFSPAYAGVAVPTLVEVAELLAGHTGLELLLEFKGDWRGLDLLAVLDDLRQCGILDRTILQSFYPETITNLHAVAPDQRRGVLVMAETPDLVAACRQAGIYTVNPHVAHLQDNPGLVDRIHQAGMRCQAWTANSPAEWQFLAELGVDGIITDQPGGLVACLDDPASLFSVAM